MQAHPTLYRIESPLNCLSEPFSALEDDPTPLSTSSSQVGSMAPSTISAVPTQAQLPPLPSLKRPASISVIDLEGEENTTRVAKSNRFKTASPYSTQPPMKGPLPPTLQTQESEFGEQDVCEISRPRSDSKPSVLTVQKRVIRRVREQIGSDFPAAATKKPPAVEIIDLEHSDVEEKEQLATGYRSKLRSGRASDQDQQAVLRESQLEYEASKLMAKGGAWSHLDHEEVIQRLSVGNYRFKCPETRRLIRDLARETGKVAIYLRESANVPLHPATPIGTLEYQAKTRELRDSLRKRQVIMLD